MKKSNLEIEKILTLSTAHIDTDTFLWLEDEVEKTRSETSPAPTVIVYDKCGGWFIFTGEIVFEDIDIFAIPKSLYDCMKLARKNDCAWLCLDRDASETDLLPKYEW